MFSYSLNIFVHLHWLEDTGTFIHLLSCSCYSTESTSQESSEKDARKQIQIQSACEWGKDRKMVLDALCRRMSQNKLSQQFYIGPYRIRPLTKIFMRKPSGSIVTYRVGL